jgi:hypothetical protein
MLYQLTRASVIRVIPGLVGGLVLLLGYDSVRVIGNFHFVPSDIDSSILGDYQPTLTHNAQTG